MKKRKEISCLVITGGPCSGKTTGMNYVSEKLRDKGFKVLIVPEVATDRILSGIDVAKAPQKLRNLIQEQFLLDQLAREDSYLKYARLYADYYGDKVVLLNDRGAMDYCAYTEPNFLKSALEEHDLNVVALRDKRYSGVFHLVTAALGAEDFYTKANNAARYEDLEEARLADGRIRDSWIGCPHFRVINNEGDFDFKLKQLMQAICRVLGIPVPLEVERKFLIKKLPIGFPIGFPFKIQKIFIEQIYLKQSGGVEERIRKRCQDNHFVCYRTEKKDISKGVRSEREEQISPREYFLMSERRDLSRQIILKNRYCFLWKDQYFELDEFINPRTDYCLLEVELTEENDRVEIPDFLEIEREVTGEEEYSNYNISLLA